MLQARNPSQVVRETGPGSPFDTRVKLIRTIGMIGAGLFAGTVLGGVVGLFVYANSREPNAHDAVFAVIQVVGVLAGLAMGYFAARGVEAQDQLLDSSNRAGLTMLKKYKPKPGIGGGLPNVGERVIGAGESKVGEDFLKTLLSATTKTNGASDPTTKPAN